MLDVVSIILNTASIVWEDDYKWKDKDWMKTRKKHNALRCTIFCLRSSFRVLGKGTLKKTDLCLILSWLMI